MSREVALHAGEGEEREARQKVVIVGAEADRGLVEARDAGGAVVAVCGVELHLDRIRAVALNLRIPMNGEPGREIVERAVALVSAACADRDDDWNLWRHAIGAGRADEVSVRPAQLALDQLAVGVVAISGGLARPRAGAWTRRDEGALVHFGDMAVAVVGVAHVTHALSVQQALSDQQPICVPVVSRDAHVPFGDFGARDRVLARIGDGDLLHHAPFRDPEFVDQARRIVIAVADVVRRQSDGRAGVVTGIGRECAAGVQHAPAY